STCVAAPRFLRDRIRRDRARPCRCDDSRRRGRDARPVSRAAAVVPRTERAHDRSASTGNVREALEHDAETTFRFAGAARRSDDVSADLHPTEDRLIDLAGQLLPPSTEGDTLRHLEECAPCEE